MGHQLPHAQMAILRTVCRPVPMLSEADRFHSSWHALTLNTNVTTHNYSLPDGQCAVLDVKLHASKRI